MRIHVLYAHPDIESFNGSLADAYCAAAAGAGHEVRRRNLAELNFDPILHCGLKRVQPLENDLAAAQENLSWCEHFALFYPVWWGNVPALLKGFFDRTLYSQFTFRHDVNDPFWRKLLEGRSADINAVRNATLEICGMQPVRVTRVGGVKGLTPRQRKAWVARVSKLPALLPLSHHAPHVSGQ